MKKIWILSISFLSLTFASYGQSSAVLTPLQKGLKLDFSDLVSASSNSAFVIKRADSRLGEYQELARVSSTSFVDSTAAKDHLYDYYYKVYNQKDSLIAFTGMEIELFGSHTLIYSPSDDKQAVGEEFNQVHDQMFGKEFSPYRYAVLFKPGDYREAGLLQVPFYMQVAGLGKTPYEVKLSNLHTPPHLAAGNGTCTFWRSAENFSVIGPETYQEEETFKWAVSQAAPLRRIYSTRTVRHQWENGWVSGGYTADCYFQAPAGSKHQQQWYTRNTHLEKGRGEFQEIKYNYVFQGVTLGEDVDKSTYQNNWDKGGNVTFLPSTPVIREKPFVYFDKGRYKVFVPALKKDRIGVSYSTGDMGDGYSLDVLDDFYVVKAENADAKVINQKLEQGKHILFTPGMYVLSEPLKVNRANTVILGLGLATLIPGEGDLPAAIQVGDVEGVSIASLMFDAHYSSKSLLQVGQQKTSVSHSKNPILLADLFFRIGGFRAGKVNVDQTVVINNNDVIGDHFWIWRADHGVRGSVAWNLNTTKNGLVVNGDHVTMYALFNEHFQEYQTLWNGEYGSTYFFQCESPYDAPEQSVYMSEDGTREGYAAYKVSDHVNHHQAYGFGIYDVLHHDIAIHSSVEVPNKPGIILKNICNNSLSNGPNRGFKFVVNDQVKSTYNTFRDNRTFLVDFKPEGATKKKETK